MKQEMNAGLTSGATDRIFLHDHIIEVEIGAFAEEFGRVQRLRFNVDLDIARQAETYADDLGNVVSYDLIVNGIRELAAGPRIMLLESFAERLAARLLSEARVARARVRIEKLDRVSGSLGVEIERRRAR
ncbi:MAG: dihydroneopterin aldolase [Pikeienuella sp.]